MSPTPKCHYFFRSQGKQLRLLWRIQQCEKELAMKTFIPIGEVHPDRCTVPTGENCCGEMD